MTTDYLQKIRESNVYDVAIRTPLEEASALSQTLRNTVLLKREDQQPVFSFKLRGAYNKISSLTDAQRAAGVVAASAGNHAQGVALAAKKLGLKALILMPTTTPSIKVDAVRSYGASIELFGDTYDESCQRALQYADEQGMSFIHPYDDPDVIAGQGTVGMELDEQMPANAHAVFVPVGGGGLIAGMAVYLKSVRPDLKIIGVEPDDAPSLHAAMAANQRVLLDQVGIFADGVAVRQVGEVTWEIAKKYVDEVILVNTDEICAAIMDIFDNTRAIMEPAGALAIAGLKKYVARDEISGQTMVAINSGANMNFDRLRHVAERAEFGEQREALFAVTIPEKPGAFRAFCEAIGNRGITEFNYRYSDNENAHIFAGVQLRGGRQERDDLLAQLTGEGYPVIDMTDNEMAKLHIRYMIGGHASQAEHEQLYRFEFPERPGALLRFLNNMAKGWNISLFHYRNHGAAYGRVLVGIQVPPSEHEAFHEFLDELGYTYWKETDNPAYRLFLA